MRRTLIWLTCVLLAVTAGCSSSSFIDDGASPVSGDAKVPAFEAGGGTEGGSPLDGGPARDGVQPAADTLPAEPDSAPLPLDVGVDDCRQDKCPAGYYCDLDSGKCMPGCDYPTDCPAHEQCDLNTHTCLCEAGYHRCGGSCVANTSVASCGSSCTPCPTDPNGQATCSGTSCGISCNSGYKRCGNACVVCPGGGEVTGTACDGNACVVSKCGGGKFPCPGGCCGWSEQQVHALNVDLIHYSALLFDSGGKAHVVYRDDKMNRLVYGRQTSSGSWDTTHLEAKSRGPVSMVLDTSGKPHVTYTVVENFKGTIKYAKLGTTSFSVKALGGGRLSALALTKAGLPHAVFYNESGSALVYTRWTTASSGWISEGKIGTMTLGTDIYQALSLALDSAGAPHVAYVARSSYQSPKDVVYASRSGGSWISTTLASGVGDYGGRPSIVFDDKNQPHVGFYANGDLTVSSRTSGGWSKSVVPGKRGIGIELRLLFNAADKRLYLSYEGLLAIRIGSAWTTHAAPAAGETHDMALDKAGHPALLTFRSYKGYYLATSK